MYLERAWNIFFVIMGRTRITINVSREVPITIWISVNTDGEVQNEAANVVEI
jgi:hypothetical protein